MPPATRETSGRALLYAPKRLLTQDAIAGGDEPIVIDLAPPMSGQHYRVHELSAIGLLPVATGRPLIGGGSPLGGLFLVPASESVESLLDAIAGINIPARGLILPTRYHLSTDGETAYRLRNVAGTQPAAGAEISEAVPAGVRWEILSIKYVLTCAAVAATRFSQLLLDDGTANVFAQMSQVTGLTTGQVGTFTWAQGLANQLVVVAAGTPNITAPFPTHLRMGPGFRWRTLTAAIQGADQYSAIQYLVREWFIGSVTPFSFVWDARGQDLIVPAGWKLRFIYSANPGAAAPGPGVGTKATLSALVSVEQD